MAKVITFLSATKSDNRDLTPAEARNFRLSAVLHISNQFIVDAFEHADETDTIEAEKLAQLGANFLRGLMVIYPKGILFFEDQAAFLNENGMSASVVNVSPEAHT